MNLAEHINRQWREHLKQYEYSRDIREGKITRMQKWSYFDYTIKSINDETLLENIINNLIFLTYIIRHPIKFRDSYLASRRETKNQSL